MKKEPATKHERLLALVAELRFRLRRILELVGEESIGHPAKEIVRICKEGLR
jgi:hypothetical protein